MTLFMTTYFAHCLNRNAAKFSSFPNWKQVFKAHRKGLILPSDFDVTSDLFRTKEEEFKKSKSKEWPEIQTLCEPEKREPIHAKRGYQWPPSELYPEFDEYESDVQENLFYNIPVTHEMFHSLFGGTTRCLGRENGKTIFVPRCYLYPKGKGALFWMTIKFPDPFCQWLIYNLERVSSSRDISTFSLKYKRHNVKCVDSLKMENKYKEHAEQCVGDRDASCVCYFNVELSKVTVSLSNKAMRVTLHDLHLYKMKHYGGGIKSNQIRTGVVNVHEGLRDCKTD